MLNVKNLKYIFIINSFNNLSLIFLLGRYNQTHHGRDWHEDHGVFDQRDQLVQHGARDHHSRRSGGDEQSGSGNQLEAQIGLRKWRPSHGGKSRLRFLSFFLLLEVEYLSCVIYPKKEVLKKSFYYNWSRLMWSLWDRGKLITPMITISESVP